MLKKNCVFLGILSACFSLSSCGGGGGSPADLDFFASMNGPFQGKVLCQVERSGDNFLLAYRYDNQKRTILLTYSELENPAQIFATETNEYDVEGRIVSASYDHDGDGVVDYRFTHEYSGLEKLTHAYDENGNIDYVLTQALDENGNSTLDEYDVNDDGVSDSTTSYAYTYDAEGRMLTSATDENDDGTVEESISYTYDADGRQTSAVGDGINTTTISTVNETAGEVTTETTDHLEGSVVTSVYSYAVECPL